MATQTAKAGSLEHAQNIVVAQFRFTAEHNAPCINLIERLQLGKGEKQMTIPKAGQATAQNLTDGVDLVSSEDIGMTYTELTTSEVGLKFVLTDKLIRQNNEDVFRIVGQQMGDAMARKRDKDVIALFSGLNGGTTLGADNLNLSFGLLARCTSVSRAKKYPNPIAVVHHPNALARGAMSGMAIDSGSAITNIYYSGILQGYSEELLRNFWHYRVNGINCFDDGNIAKIGTTDSGYGAIFSKHAMAMIESQAPTTERERDASLRAWEVVMVADYGCYEIDDGYGAPMRYEIGDLVTTST